MKYNRQIKCLRHQVCLALILIFSQATQAQTRVPPVKKFYSSCLASVIKDSREEAAADCPPNAQAEDYQYLVQAASAYCRVHYTTTLPSLSGCPYDYFFYLTNGSQYGCMWTSKRSIKYTPEPIQPNEPPCPSDINDELAYYNQPPMTVWVCPAPNGGVTFGREDSPPECTVPTKPRDGDCNGGTGGNNTGGGSSDDGGSCN